MYNISKSVIFILTIVILIFLACVFEIIREIHTFTITEYVVTTDKISKNDKDITIIFLSDLHNRIYGKNNSRLLQAVKQQSPDFILIGGDMIVGMSQLPFNHTLQFVRELTRICPVVYSNGNHEQRLKIVDGAGKENYDFYKDELIKNGVIYLENSNVLINSGNSKIRIFGLELPFVAFKKFHKMPMDENDISEMIGKMDAGKEECYKILLAHNPAYMDAYLKWGADMILSGHLHGGLVRVPGIGGIITPQGFFFPKYSGEMTKLGNQTVIVSRGLGTHTLNIRLFNTPELISIRLTHPNNLL